MRRFLLPSFFFLASALALGLSVSTPAFGQAKTGDTKGKDGEKPAENPKKEDPKKEEPKKDTSKEAPKDAAKEEAKEPEFPLPENYEALMKKFRGLKSSTKRSLKNMDVDKMKGLAAEFEFYSGKIVETDKDKDKRFENADYKGWAKDFQDAAKSMKAELEKAKIDWDAVTKSNEAILQSCANCHDKYHEED